MKKLFQLFAVLAVVLLSGCASTEDMGMAVGGLSNTECANKTRYPVYPTMTLTKDGDKISCQFINFGVNCAHGDIGVSCKHNGFNLDIKIHEDVGGGSGLAANCTCPINIYFTIYGATDDSYHVTLDGWEICDVSFKEHNTAFYDFETRELKYF